MPICAISAAFSSKLHKSRFANMWLFLVERRQCQGCVSLFLVLGLCFFVSITMPTSVFILQCPPVPFQPCWFRSSTSQDSLACFNSAVNTSVWTVLHVIKHTHTHTHTYIHVFTDGSCFLSTRAHTHRELIRNPNFTCNISAAFSSKLHKSRFANIWLFLVERGITAAPLCSAQRSTTCG